MLSSAPQRLRIGEKITKGLGSGGNPDIGQRAAEESREETPRDVERRPTWCLSPQAWAAAPVRARRPSWPRRRGEMGALTIGVVTRPFTFEGTQRRRAAEQAIENLSANVDTLITIPNDRLLQIADKKTGIKDAFRLADDVLRQGIQGISELITVPGPDQPGLCRREDHHAGRRRGLDGDRPRQRREPGARGGRTGHPQRAARRLDRGRAFDHLQHQGRRGHEPVRGERGGRSDPGQRASRVQHHLRRRHRSRR